MARPPIHLYRDIVRFEDVDAAAIVYHPTYLTFLERARSQSLLDKGHSFKRILDDGLGMVLASAEMKYIRPLVLEDRFVVASQINDYQKSTITMTQALVRNDKPFTYSDIKSELRHIEGLHFYAHLKFVVICRQTMRPTAIPSWMSDLLAHDQPALIP